MTNEATIQGAQAAGFSAVLILPAITSTLHQAQREASPALHVLAAYIKIPNGTGALPPLSPEQESAAAKVAAILTEQAINGPLFFLAVRALVLAFGPVGGMFGQIAITANTMANPENNQTLNPGRMVVGNQGNWYEGLPQPARRSFVALMGSYARACGYGAARQAGCDPTLVLIGVSRTAPVGVWHTMIDRPTKSTVSF